MAISLLWISSWAVILSAVCGITAGFQWQNEEPQIVNGCVGSSITLSWGFTKEPQNSVGTIHWFRFARQTLASYVDGSITNPDKRFRPTGSQGDLSISRLTVRDTGLYEVEVKILSKDDKSGKQVETVYSATAMLMVGDPPVISGEQLAVQEVTSDEGCALERQVTLRCGHFTKRGVPPVEVKWTDPAGQQLPSTRYVQGQFQLDLPLRPLTGNYTCHALCQNPVLHCLAPDSPLKTAPQIRLGPPSSEGCSDAAREDWDKESSNVPDSKAQGSQRLVSNLTELRHMVADLQKEQTNLKNQYDRREDDFRVKVEELRELVLLSNQQSVGAQVHVLQQTLRTLQNSLHDVQQNVTTLQQRSGSGSAGGAAGGGWSPQNVDRDRAERARDLRDVQNTLQTLRAKLDLNEQKLQSLEEKVVSTSIGLSLTQTLVSSLQESLSGNEDVNVNVPIPVPEDRFQNLTDLWQNLQQLEGLHAETLREVRTVYEAQQSFQRRQDNLTVTVRAASARMEVMEDGLGRRVDRTAMLWNATKNDVNRLARKVRRLEQEGRARAGGSGVEAGVGAGDGVAPGGNPQEIEPALDPLVSQVEPTFSLSPPWDKEKDSLIHDFLLMEDGRVVIADRYHADVIVADNVTAGADVTTYPLRYGRHVRRLALLEDGLVAATVDDRFIHIFDTSSSSSASADADDDDRQTSRQRWVRTPYPYRGIATRSAQTLYAGASAKDTGGVARIDIISIVDDVAIVVSTVTNGTVTSELQDPSGLTVHGKELFVCDWKSSHVLRVHLQTLQVVVLSGPWSGSGSGSELLRFFQPRKAVFDLRGNMYLSTGGRVCGTEGEGLYSRGFCVVVISQEGWWDRLVTRGRHIYPYGVALTPTGLAVSWGSWVQNPTRSLIQWYDLIHPYV